MPKSWSKGLTKETDGRILKISEKMKGNQHGKGNKHTEEFKEKMRKRAKELWQDPGYRKKMAIGNSGEKNPSWKGGRFKRADGYVLVWNPECKNSRSHGYVLEHRLVMSKILGRPLKKTEIVHHINGKRGDNSPGNLYLETRGTHKTGYLAGYKQGYATALVLSLMIKDSRR